MGFCEKLPFGKRPHLGQKVERSPYIGVCLGALGNLPFCCSVGRVIRTRLRISLVAASAAFDVVRAPNQFLICGCLSLMAVACNAPTPEEQRRADLSERVAKEMREWAEVQEIWRQKEREDQGCDGEILSGSKLREVTVGKTHLVMRWGIRPDPKREAVEARTYYTDGRLNDTLMSDLLAPSYSIEGELMCHKAVYFDEEQVQSCFRLIQSPDGKIFEERLVAPGIAPELATNQKLTCLQLDITDLEDG